MATNARAGGVVILTDVLNDSIARVAGLALIADALNDSKAYVADIALIVDTLVSLEVSPASADVITDAQFDENPTIIYEGYPVADDTVGTWLDQLDQGTNLYQAISDEDANTYIKSVDTPLHEVYIAALQPMSGYDPDIGIVNVIYTLKRLDSGFVHIIVSLKQNDDVIASWTHVGLSLTPVEYTQTLTSGQLAEITSFSELYLEFDAYSYGDALVDGDGNLIIDADGNQIMESY